jgi:CHAT domain-containing protein
MDLRSFRPLARLATALIVASLAVAAPAQDRTGAIATVEEAIARNDLASAARIARANLDPMSDAAGDDAARAALLANLVWAETRLPVPDDPALRAQADAAAAALQPEDPARQRLALSSARGLLGALAARRGDLVFESAMAARRQQTETGVAQTPDVALKTDPEFAATLRRLTTALADATPAATPAIEAERRLIALEAEAIAAVTRDQWDDAGLAPLQGLLAANDATLQGARLALASLRAGAEQLFGGGAADVRQALSDGVAIASDPGLSGHPAVPDFWWTYAVILVELEEGAEAARAAEAAIDAWERGLGFDAPGDAYVTAIRAHALAGDRDAATARGVEYALIFVEALRGDPERQARLLAHVFGDMLSDVPDDIRIAVLERTVFADPPAAHPAVTQDERMRGVLGGLYEAVGRFAEQRALLTTSPSQLAPEVAELLVTAQAEPTLATAELLEDRGSRLNWAEKRTHSAIALYDRALDLRRALSPPDDRALNITAGVLAAYLDKIGRRDDAVTLMRDQIALILDRKGRDHAASSVVLQTHADFFEEIGLADEAGYVRTLADEERALDRAMAAGAAIAARDTSFSGTSSVSLAIERLVEAGLEDRARALIRDYAPVAAAAPEGDQFSASFWFDKASETSASLGSPALAEALAAAAAIVRDGAGDCDALRAGLPTLLDRLGCAPDAAPQTSAAPEPKKPTEQMADAPPADGALEDGSIAARIAAMQAALQSDLAAIEAVGDARAAPPGSIADAEARFAAATPGSAARALIGLQLATLYRQEGRDADADATLAPLLDRVEDPDFTLVGPSELAGVATLRDRMTQARAEAAAAEAALRDHPTDIETRLRLFHALIDAAAFDEAVAAARRNAVEPDRLRFGSEPRPEGLAFDLMGSARQVAFSCDGGGDPVAWRALARPQDCAGAAVALGLAALDAVAEPARDDPTNPDLRAASRRFALDLVALTDGLAAHTTPDIRDAAALRSLHAIEALAPVDPLRGLALLEAAQDGVSPERLEALRRVERLRFETRRAQVAMREAEARGAATDSLRAAPRALAATLAEAETQVAPLAAAPDSLDPRLLSRALGPDDAVVVYAIEGDRIAAWTLADGRVTARILPVAADETRRHLRLLRSGLDPTAVAAGSAAPVNVRAAHELWRSLLAPLSDEVGAAATLRIVPDGFIALVPFPALTPTAPPSPIWTVAQDWTPDWLVTRHAVAYAPSLATLDALARRIAPSRARADFLGLGAPNLEGSGPAPASVDAVIGPSGPEPDRVRQLPPLPAARRELESMAAFADAGGARLLLGDDFAAGPLGAVDWAGYRVIAFATHGLTPADADSATGPALTLTPRPGGAPLLTADDARFLGMDADLVILSSCNSGVLPEGSAQSGLSGFADAFIGAGARTVVVSQWPVIDAAVESLTLPLVEAALDRRRVAQALQAAAAALAGGVGGDALRHPLFWAPLTVVGDATRAR